MIRTLEDGKPFSFADYGYSEEVTPILRDMYSRVYQIIRGGVEKEWLPILQLRTLYQVNYSLKYLLVDDTDIGSVTLRSLEKLRLHLLIVYVLLLCHATTLV